MKFTLLDHDHEFTIDLPRRPKKGLRIEHDGNEYIVGQARIIDGREVFDVRGPKSLQAGLDGMSEWASLTAKDD